MMQHVMAITDTGEGKAWELLAAADPAAVVERAAVEFAPAAGCYRLASFGRHFSVHPADRRIHHLEPEGAAFLQHDAYFFRLTVLWYLVKAGPARPSGTLVRPAGLPGGEIFLRGTHVLPLDKLGAKYATRPAAFLAAGAALGGTPAGHGDAAIVLSPLPKVPTTVILWAEDDEFPARADLLFDATCTAHLPLDILWSVAMLAVQTLLEPAAFGRR
jgi:hypothetical protein